MKLTKQHTPFRSRIGSLTSMIKDTVKLRKPCLKGPFAYMNQRKLDAFVLTEKRYLLNQLNNMEKEWI